MEDQPREDRQVGGYHPDPLRALLVNAPERTGSDSNIARRNTDVSVAAFENEGTVRVSHNWPVGPGNHTAEMSQIESASGIFIEATEAISKTNVFLALSPREARTLGRALISVADEVGARVRIDK